ncbi:jumonji domain-containing protein [Raphidocelis subcapitata]|uniref:Jumonji domain-containing protein n=1 Tax=Raphidocelis subcapitata TaxID=307507 RepID=A0A2V0NQD6_9CHLO|nr:jumonji domain-containing protein [Raphidocelis subcapitata]|eukprot:GBF87753.1 jumonji domain-containing protein [Raphidocelis subcapitata]
MGRENGGEELLVLRPTVAEFSKPFTEFVRKVLKQHPNIGMFKVVPPQGWKARRRPFPKLSSVEIATPIKQIVYGKGGVYRCILMEQKGLTAERFKELSESEGRRAPESKRGKDLGDALLERSFWSSVTINPPFYGADTPQSFFDEKLDYGWNLRHLEGCLLRRSGVPQIPGVTSPMTYFGMWKSFFSWHVEDADLYSINFLHWGAPKVWYCVAPSQRDKFERMAQSLYPELHRGCRAFMRHKDVLLSPQMLKTYGVEYTMAKQEPGEFIVLNAAAYHAGYNLGFNCAEAINFALPEWVDMGRRVVRCKCDVMRDGVRISMRYFGCETDSSDEEDDDESSGTDATDSGSDGESGEGSEAEGSDEEEEEGEEEGADGAPRARASRRVAAQAKAKAASPSSAAAAAAGGKRGAPASPPDSPPAPKRPKGRQTRTALAAAAAASKQRSSRTSAEARARLAAKGKRGGKVSPSSAGADTAGLHPTDLVLASLRRAAAAAADMRAAHAVRAAAAAAAAGEAPDAAASDAGAWESSGGGDEFGAASDGPVSGSEPPSPTAARASLRRAGRLPSGGGGGGGGAVAAPSGAAPQVIVGESRGKRFFYLVQPMQALSGPAAAAAAAAARPKGLITLRWLKESSDGLFRPSAETWEEKAEALVSVRTQWVTPPDGGPGGWRLLTLRSRILDTEFID